MDHADLFQNGQTDLDAAKILFREEYYGNTAFLLQQALEKHIKGFMLKRCVFDNVKDLKHLPYVAIFKKYLEGIKHYATQIPQLNFKPFIEFFESVLEQVTKLTTDDELKIAVWKESLQISLSETENSLIDNLNIQIDYKMKKVESVLPDLSRQIENYVGLDKLNQLDLSELDKKTKSSIKVFNNIHTSLKSPQTSKSYITNMQEFVDELGYGTGKDSLSKDMTLVLEYSISIMQSFAWMDLMIDLFPHETLSRYPENVDGKMINDWYAEYKDNLLELLKNTETVCEDIRKTK